MLWILDLGNPCLYSRERGVQEVPDSEFYVFFDGIWSKGKRIAQGSEYRFGSLSEKGGLVDKHTPECRSGAAPGTKLVWTLENPDAPRPHPYQHFFLSSSTSTIQHQSSRFKIFLGCRFQPERSTWQRDDFDPSQ